MLDYMMYLARTIKNCKVIPKYFINKIAAWHDEPKKLYITINMKLLLELSGY